METKIIYHEDALEYIAKLADGHLRDALTMLDKCLSYSTELTVEKVVEVLGVADYNSLMTITDGIIGKDGEHVLKTIDKIHLSGVDLKQFIRQYLIFMLDVNKYLVSGSTEYTQLPSTKIMNSWLNVLTDKEFEVCQHLLDTLIKLNSEIKWDANPKYIIEARLLSEVYK